MAFPHGQRMAVALLCVHLALRTALAAKKGEPLSVVVEDDAPGYLDNIELPPPRGANGYASVQSLEGSAELFDRLEHYQSGRVSAESDFKQVTYVKTPYAIGEPYIDKGRRAWVPIRADIGAIDETLAETGAMSVHSHSRSKNGGSSRIWLLAPFTIGEPNFDDATQATFVPFYSAAQSKTGTYKVHSPNPDRAPASVLEEDDKGKEGTDDKGSSTCATDKLEGKCPCEPECGNGGCLLLHRWNYFGSCNTCCSNVKSTRLSSKSFDEGPAPPSRRASLRQPTSPYAVSYPPMRPRRPPPAFFAGQPGAERFDDYAYDEVPREPHEYAARR